MLKVKTVYDYRQEVCEALRSGKYQLSNRAGYHSARLNEYCAIGVAAAALGVGLEGDLDALQDMLGITATQRIQIEHANDDASDEDRVLAVTAYIEALP